MILYQGELFISSKKNDLLNTLYKDILKTLKDKPLDIHLVIEACHKLYQNYIEHAYDELLLPFINQMNIDIETLNHSVKLLSKEGLQLKIKTELGDSLHLNNIGQTQRKILPLGVLFHIAASNMELLPMYTVIEGLLTGNINILKLPSNDRGISLILLKELIRIEPILKNYIYIFDIPSSDKTTIEFLANMSNAVVIWGSDDSIKSLRSSISVQTKIIEWGHKLSFAYVNQTTTDKDLILLAHHILQTNQTLCSSVQGIYFDTYNHDTLVSFGKRFFEILKDVNKLYKKDIGMIARNTLEFYTRDLTSHTDSLIYNEDGVSVEVKFNSSLELSLMFGHVWIKKLPKKEIIDTLHPYRNHLQTCALLINEDKDTYINELIQAGIVRITNANASRMFIGEAHDGVYPLRLYSRIVEIDK